VTPDTVRYLFWGYLAGFLLLGIWIGRLAVRLSALARRMDRLAPPGSRPEKPPSEAAPLSR
jgi:hypothetical protein